MTRRFLAGLLIGLVVAVLEVLLMALGPTATPGGIVRNGSGGAIRLLVAGAALGAAYALLFRPAPGSHPENVMGGVVIGVVTWVVFALSVFPILTADAPMWHVDTAARMVPELIAYVPRAAGAPAAGADTARPCGPAPRCCGCAPRSRCLLTPGP